MSTNGNRVKLYIYHDEGKEVIIDSLTGREWEDFILITVRSDIAYETMDRLKEMLHSDNKKIVIVPEGTDIRVYGVRLDDGKAELRAAAESND